MELYYIVMREFLVPLFAVDLLWVQVSQVYIVQRFCSLASSVGQYAYVSPTCPGKNPSC